MESSHKHMGAITTVTPPSSLLIPGYHIEKILGRGGMATLYLARQESLQRTVVIKVLDQELLDETPQLKTHFADEALIISRLVHPNIVQVIDRGENQQQLWFVMEYIKGVHLGKAISMAKLNLAQKFKIALGICLAIEYAHQNQILHCDIKPENILVDMKGGVKVLDFGIASTSQPVRNDSKGCLVAGTLRYMAPELIKSGSTNNFPALPTVQSDIYSLGLVLHELFSGCPPSNQAHQQYRPLKSSGLNIPTATVAALDDCIVACLSSNPVLRPSSVQAIYMQLLQQSHGTHIKQDTQMRAKTALNKKSFQLLEVLKESERSACYLFVEKNTGQKIVLKKYAESTGFYQLSKRLSHDLSQRQHNHLLRILGVSNNNRAFVVIEEYMQGGCMSQRQLRPLLVQDFLDQAKQVCGVMVAMEREGVYHGQLSADNIYYAAPSEDGAITLKVSGFSQQSQDTTKQEEYRRRDLLAAADIFYRLLTGEAASSVTVNTAAANHNLARLPEVLQPLLDDMWKAPATLTWKVVHQMLAGLQSDLATRVLTSQAMPIAEAAPAWAWPKKRIVLAIVGSVVCIAAAALWHFYLRL